MKICHLSDSHLGAGESFQRRAASGLTERQEDIIGGFIEAIDRIIEIKPDLCLHSGDLFHTVRPLNSIMAVAARQLHRLAAVNGIPTVIIAGNHDAPRQPHVGAPLDVLRQIDNLHVAASGKAERFRVAGSSVCALPHCLTPSILKDQLEYCHPESEAGVDILVAHGVAAGMPEFSMADLGELELPLEIMRKFDYVALGHYHNFRRVLGRAWYAGSTERLSQSEREAAKGFAVVELDPFEVRFEAVRARPMVDLAQIDAAGRRGDQVAQLLRDKLNEVGSADKVVRVTVENVSPETLRTLPSETLAELKEQAYALDIRFEREVTDERPTGFGRSAIGRLDKSFLEYLQVVDTQGFDQERLIREALKYLEAEE